MSEPGDKDPKGPKQPGKDGDPPAAPDALGGKPRTPSSPLLGSSSGGGPPLAPRPSFDRPKPSVPEVKPEPKATVHAVVTPPPEPSVVIAADEPPTLAPEPLPTPAPAAVSAPVKTEPAPAARASAQVSAAAAAWGATPPAAPPAAQPAAQHEDPYAASPPPREPKPPKSPRGTPPSDGRMRRFKLYALGAALLAFLIVVITLLSWRNSRYLYLECHEDKVVALQGSSWPWGRNKLGGGAYHPVRIPPEADCRDRTYTDQSELDRAFVELLIDRAQVGLRSKKPEEVSEASNELTQALLLTRAHSERRDLIQRLQGDLAYRTGGQSVEEAQKRILEAITHFKEAVEHRPVHFHDAEAWIAHLEAAGKALEEGPRPADRIAEAAGQPAPPPGSIQPTPSVTPEKTSATPAAEPDAAVPSAPKPDAGLPQGGVLL